MKTYGKLAHGEVKPRKRSGSKFDPKPRASWGFEVQPHVAMRLKRLFASISRGSHGLMWVTDTPETSRDVAWFLDRYPLEMSDTDRALLARRAEMHAARTDTIGSVVEGLCEPRDFEMALPPREYQRLAAEVLLQSGSLLVADDLGLGKTITAIAALTHRSTRPALVVTVTSLPKQWRDQLAKFAPQLRTHIITKATPYDIVAEMNRKPRGRRKPTAATLPGVVIDAFPDVIILSYSKLTGWADYLAGVVKSVAFDECQELRHYESQKYQSATHIAETALYRLGLSATPIFNVGSEMWAVLNVLAPDALGTREEFVREWCDGGQDGKERVKNPRAFGTYLRDAGLMLRRTKADVGQELPKLQNIPHHVESDPAALDAIKNSATELARIILREGEAHRGEKMHASEELSNKIRQATGIAKAPYVAHFVDLLLESEQRIILFGWHRDVYRIWQEHFGERAAMFTGTESPTQKLESMRRFVSGEARVLIMSLRAGAGIDGLQNVCRTVVYGELDWSPRVHDQCTGRAYRDGQKDPVVAYYLISDVGSDPIVADVLGVKRQQCEAINDPDAEIVEALDVDPERIRRLAASYLEQRGVLAGAEAKAAE